MDINEIIQKYNLDSGGLAKILKKHNIILLLEHLSDIPDAWIPIIETDLGLVSSKDQNEKLKSKTSKALLNLKKPLKERKELYKKIGDVIRQVKQIVETNAVYRYDSVRASLNNQEDQDLSPPEKLETEYRKLPGPKISGEKIDISKFNELKKKVVRNSHLTKSDSRKQKIEKIFFYAYIIFIGKENDHAFIKRIEDINKIGEINLYERDESSYKLIEDCSYINKGEIILCSEKSHKYKLASIEDNCFEGVISNLNTKSFIDLTFFHPFRIIENINTPYSLEKYFYGVFNIVYKRSKLEFELTNLTFDKIKLLERLKTYFDLALLKPEFSNQDMLLINCHKELSEKVQYDSEIKSLFDKEIRTFGQFQETETLLAFITKWEYLDITLVSLDNFGNLDLLPEYFKLWLDNKLNIGFWGTHLVDAIVKYELQLRAEQYESDETFRIGERLQYYHKKKITEQLIDYLGHDLNIVSYEIYEILVELIEVSNLLNKKEVINNLDKGLTPTLSYEQWKANKSDVFHKEIAFDRFAEEDNAIQERILDLLDDNEISKIITYIKPQNNIELNKRILKVLSFQISENIEALSFDLESNGNTIFELGWVNDENHYFKNSEIQEGLELFKQLTQPSDIIFIGHNIVEWDVPILSKMDITIQPEQIWDTLLVEAFLSPEFKNYALITAHNAIDDAKFTRDLFLNQVLRMMYADENKLLQLFSYLPTKIVEQVSRLRDKELLNWKPLAILEKEKKAFYRPQPKSNTLIEQVKEIIAVSENKNVLIVGSEFVKNEILEIENIKFHVADEINKNFYKINRNKITDIENVDIWIKHVLLNFVDYNNSLNRPSFWGQLPTSIKIKVENNVSHVLDLFFDNEEIDWASKNLLFFTIPELLLYQEQLSHLKDINVITIQSDLISVENKKLLKEVSLDFLMNVTKDDDPIWLKFSRGQSLTELSIKQCQKLNVSLPELFDNVWIEKSSHNKFNIWGNYNWEKLLDNFNVKNKIDVQPKVDEFKKSQTIIAEVSAVETLKSKVTRFNPESFYRSRYWVFQKQLVDQIVLSKNASVLIIQRYDEIEVLQNYFKHLGYYVPDHSISIGRRLELLHQNKATHKLIIEHVSKLDIIIRANYIDSLNVIIDSFNLSENYFSAFNSIYFENLNNKRLKKLNEIEEADDEYTINDNDVLITSKRPVISDKFFLIELLKPRVSHIRSLLQNANDKHKLWILDPRLNDFSGLYKSWNVSKKTLKVWKDFEAYETAVKEADIHIDSVKPMQDLPFDKNRIKEILQQVFLKEFEWRESQIPYLDVILDGKEDQLITLPTGEGKSVLFQGPALFKSAFTNRLTIVVTPLKALMEDQVEALWQKGFFGSVDYINSDRSSDINSIYRAMAGGELSLLFVTPERFRSRSFNNALQMRIQSDGGLEYGVFDEAHCVSQWGHEFRPDYFNCAKRLVKLKKLSHNNFPLLLFSATVSEKIYNDFKIIFS